MPIGIYKNWDACETDQVAKLKQKHPDWSAETCREHAKRICGWLEQHVKGEASFEFQAGYELFLKGNEVFVQGTIADRSPSKHKNWGFHDGPVRLTDNARRHIAETLKRSELRGPRGPLELGHKLNYVLADKPIEVVSNGALKAVWGPITDVRAMENIRNQTWKALSGVFIFNWDTATIDDFGVATIDEAYVGPVDFVGESAFPAAKINKVCSNPIECRIVTALAEAVYGHAAGSSKEDRNSLINVRADDPSPQVAPTLDAIKGGEEMSKMNESQTDQAVIERTLCEEESAQLRSKYNISAENSKKLQFLYTPTDKFSDWKFPVRDNKGNLVKEMVEGAIKRLHMTSEAIQRIVRPKLRRLAKQLGINAESLGASLEGEEEFEMNEQEMNAEKTFEDKYKTLETAKNLESAKLVTATADLGVATIRIGALEDERKVLAQELRDAREEGSKGVTVRNQTLQADMNRIKEDLGNTARARFEAETKLKTHLAGDLADIRIKARMDKPQDRANNVTKFVGLPISEIESMTADAGNMVQFLEANGILADTWGAGATTRPKVADSLWTVGDRVHPEKD